MEGVNSAGVRRCGGKVRSPGPHPLPWHPCPPRPIPTLGRDGAGERVVIRQDGDGGGGGKGGRRWRKGMGHGSDREMCQWIALDRRGRRGAGNPSACDLMGRILQEHMVS